MVFQIQSKSDFPPERLHTFMESFYKLLFSFNLPVHITFVHFEMFCCLCYMRFFTFPIARVLQCSTTFQFELSAIAFSRNWRSIFTRQFQNRKRTLVTCRLNNIRNKQHYYIHPHTQFLFKTTKMSITYFHISMGIFPRCLILNTSQRFDSLR